MEPQNCTKVNDVLNTDSNGFFLKFVIIKSNFVFIIDQPYKVNVSFSCLWVDHMMFLWNEMKLNKMG